MTRDELDDSLTPEQCRAFFEDAAPRSPALTAAERRALRDASSDPLDEALDRVFDLLVARDVEVGLLCWNRKRVARSEAPQERVT